MSFLIVLSLAGALAQSPAAPTRGAIAGQVLAEDSLTPIAGAEVTLLPAMQRPMRGPFTFRPHVAVTDNAGRFDVAGLEPGRYRLTIQKAGFAAVDGLDAVEVNLTAGHPRHELKLTMTRGGAIAGRVVDESGEPLAEVRVMAMRRPPARGGMAPPPDFLLPMGPGGQTNDLGEFRLFGLQPGEYYVQAAPRFEMGRASAPRATIELATFYPSTNDSAAATPVTVAPGHTVNDLVVRMITAPAFQVSGVVKDEAGRPIADAMVKLVNDGRRSGPMLMMPWIQARTDAAGRFTIANAANGSYVLSAAAPIVVSSSGRRTPGAGTGAVAWASGGSNDGTGVVSTFAGGVAGPGLARETTNGSTIEWRDDTGSRMPITIDHADVTGLEVVVKRPPR